MNIKLKCVRYVCYILFTKMTTKMKSQNLGGAGPEAGGL
jgi:hypothetical protein